MLVFVKDNDPIYTLSCFSTKFILLFFEISKVLVRSYLKKYVQKVTKKTMVKVLNRSREQYGKAIANKRNSSLCKVLVLPILSTLLCLTATCTTHAQQSRAGRVGDASSSSSFPSSQRVAFYGNLISLNGHTLPGAWLQQGGTSGLNTQLSDGAVRQLFGVDLLSSSNPLRQPVQWFSSVTKPEILAGLLLGGYRYLDITDLARTAGWQIQADGNTLVITTPTAKINIHQEQQTLGDAYGKPPSDHRHIIVDLDRPTPWQVTQESPVRTSQPSTEWTITLEGSVGSVRIVGSGGEKSPPSVSEVRIQKIEVVKNQTIIHLSVTAGLFPQVSTLPDPYRLIINVLPDVMVQRDIAWAPGLRWRQQYVNLGQERFPVVWLEVNPRTFGIKLKPIWTQPDTLVGTAPLIQTAQRYLAVAAINGGFFNRNNQLPLGAIRRDGQWLSSPILNRGAIAWNDSGQFYMGRLTLLETLIGTNNVQLPISVLNSGYVQNGIARYTPVWGATYTPLSDNEIILVVQKNQITDQLPGGKASQTAIPIPRDGYLLILRSQAISSVSKLPVGSFVNIISSTSPANFSRYPYIVGAGPLLLQNRQIVLDAKAEQFSNAFIAQKAIRSGICTTATGTLMIAAVHNRVGGAGPTLAEHAQLMKLLGCMNALNLDGGSSTSLYLGGQILDRSPSTAARVHNGIGIFLGQ